MPRSPFHSSLSSIEPLEDRLFTRMALPGLTYSPPAVDRLLGLLENYLKLNEAQTCSVMLIEP